MAQTPIREKEESLGFVLFELIRKSNPMTYPASGSLLIANPAQHTGQNRRAGLRLLFWVVLLGVIGGWVQMKGASISYSEVVVGVIVGATVGYLIGVALGWRRFR